MATELELQFCLCGCCDDNLSFQETTGLQSDANPGGYGGSNPATSDAATAVLEIQFPNPSTLLPDSSNSVAINMATRGFPRTDNVTSEISPEDAGLGEGGEFQDGMYYLVYTITGTFNSNDFTATQGIYFLRTCELECCLQKKLANGKCKCGDIGRQKLFDAFLALENAKWAAECGNLDDAIRMYKKAKNACDNCKDCG